MKIAATVILYNPDLQVVKNILQYTMALERIFIIDNSTYIDPRIKDTIQTIPNSYYCSCGGNIGIAAALNKAIFLALQEKYEYLLTMDQDSSFSINALREYLDNVSRVLKKEKNVAVVGTDNGIKVYFRERKYLYVDEVITSGAIINLKIAEILHGYKESLFIDFVDYEYCYRAKKLGYYTIAIRQSNIQHQIGGMNPINIGPIHIKNHNEHNKIRFYYIARNVIYVINNYPEQRIKWMKYIVKMLIKILLVENNKKWKFIEFFRGLKDAFRGVYGEYSSK